MIDLRVYEIQGDSVRSPYANKEVRTSGVVTGITRKGYFIQDPVPNGHGSKSDGIFVYSKSKPKIQQLVNVRGRVVDYEKEGNGRPVTQIQAFSYDVIEQVGPKIHPVIIGREIIRLSIAEQVTYLTAHEGMLMAIEEGAIFMSPSNPYGDYVVLPIDDGVDSELIRTPEGGVLISQSEPEKWYPNFRISNYNHAPKVNVGAKLLSTITGPLNYRAGSFQMSVLGEIAIENTEIHRKITMLDDEEDSIGILTLNGFNLDVKKENASKVMNPRKDIDDDVGDGRFAALGVAIVQQAKSPEIVALQEIQDNDGAEISATVSAKETYQMLISAIVALGGPEYKWVDIPPEVGQDGGQPGGNIRNGYLYDPERVTLLRDTVTRLGDNTSAYKGSRKSLLAQFRLSHTGKILAVVNVHLASKRHQQSIFAEVDPGIDPKEPIRIEQVEIINATLQQLETEGVDYCVTGDFNDIETSKSLQKFTGENDLRINLVQTLAKNQRYDYNHRGKLQVLMHSIVPKYLSEAGRVKYDIIHGNELIGVEPGQLGEKPSDHAYVLTQLFI
jgi:predicted extracellular nuclease